MKIVHLSTNDAMGGAARAAYRVHSGLRALGHDSSMYVLAQHTQDETVHAVSPGRAFTDRVRRRFRRKLLEQALKPYLSTRPAGLEIYSEDRTLFGRDILRQLPQADIINLHWVAGFLDYVQCLPVLAKRTPLVWRMADMNVFTGGCHYDLDCSRYAAQCGQCPQLGSHNTRDLSRKVWQRKRRAFSSMADNRLHIVATSRWIAQKVAQSSLLGRFPVTMIPNGLDLQVFKPSDRQQARQQLKLPSDARIVLFVADDVDNPRKGMALLIDAINRLSDLKNILLVSVGRGAEKMHFSCSHQSFGFVRDDRLMSLIYGAADVFVIPSLHESFGQTAIEAIACGTPVVGFRSGGMEDTIRHQETGLLVPAGDTEALSLAIADLLSNEAKRLDMARRGRERAVREYGMESVASRYVALYGRALDAQRTPSQDELPSP